MATSDVKPQRQLYIDNIRWLMIVLVIVVHSAVIYGPAGQFFGFEDRDNTDDISAVLLLLVSVLIQAFFMGLLFLIAGYFLPSSLERKGRRRFIWDRFKRLGIPSLIFILFLAPLINYPLYNDDEMSFALYASRYYFDPPDWDDGPMWFAVALLLFSIAWAFTPRTWTLNRFKGPLTRSRIAILIGLAAAGTFLVRLVFPIGTDVWNMQLCFFTQYVLLFLVGIIAYRNDWLASLQMKDAKFWLTVSIVSIFAFMFPMMIAGGALDGEFDPYNGGLTWQAAALSFWEQIFGIGMCVWFLVWFRERHNTQDRLVKKISDNAFAVYVFHPPVLIALAVILSDYSAPGILKFPILVAATIVITFSLAEFVLRRTPFLKQVL